MGLVVYCILGVPAFIGFCCILYNNYIKKNNDNSSPIIQINYNEYNNNNDNSSPIISQINYNGHSIGDDTINLSDDDDDDAGYKENELSRGDDDTYDGTATDNNNDVITTKKRKLPKEFDDDKKTQPLSKKRRTRLEEHNKHSHDMAVKDYYYYADTCGVLKKFIKNKYKDYQKKYIQQIIHEIMFTALLICYKYVKLYKQKKYGSVADTLNITNTLAKVSKMVQNNDNDNKDDDIDVDVDDDDRDDVIERDRLLSNMFGAYFKNNYNYVLKKDLVIADIMNDIIKLCNDKDITDLGDDEKQQITVFVDKCCDVCWIMILQDPILEFHPTSWKSVNKEEYNEDQHKRVSGSVRKAKNVLYYVWPAISRNGNVCGDAKIDVVVRDDFFRKI